MSFHTRNFLLAFGTTVIWFFIMRPFTPPNIVAFELAGTTEAAGKIIFGWTLEQLSNAIISIYLDFGFILAYCCAFMFACRASANYSNIPFFIKVTKHFIIAIWIAGICDVIENIAMLETLDFLNQPSTFTSQTPVSIAFYFATLKFGIVLLALIFVLICFVTGLFTRKATT